MNQDRKNVLLKKFLFIGLILIVGFILFSLGKDLKLENVACTETRAQYYGMVNKGYCCNE